MTKTNTAPLGVGLPSAISCTRYSIDEVEERLVEIRQWIKKQPMSGHAARFDWNASQFGIVVIMEGMEACFICN